jgi:hypothetical protein
MKPKHTPGPWRVGNGGKPLFGYYSVHQAPRNWDGMGYQAIASLVARAKSSSDFEEFEANARLVANAPDLLRAGENLRAAQRAYMEDRGNEKLGRKVAACAKRFDAVLAKAR